MPAYSASQAIPCRVRCGGSGFRAGALAAALAAVVMIVYAEAARAQSTGAAGAQTHMSESLRASIDEVVVIGGVEPAEKELTGTYEEFTPGLYGGISKGAAMGSPSMEVGPVNVSFPIPILTLPGAIVGGITGKAERDLQKFRDALTEELAGAANQPLNNSRLALGVYRDLDRLPALRSELFAEAVPVPDDADAILYVNIDSLTIDVEDADAKLTTTASVALNDRGDGSKLYDRVILYQDRAALTQWTKNDNVLFRDYANFALHFLGREIAAEVFGRVQLRHELRPAGSDSVRPERRNEWRADSRAKAPTLAWEFALLGGDAYGPWTGTIDESSTVFDVEIYDAKRLVYARSGIAGLSHTVAAELEPCKTYRWTVRPSYPVENGLKYGNWMRRPPIAGRDTGLEMVGRDASVAPAYIQDFATLAIDCRAR